MTKVDMTTGCRLGFLQYLFCFDSV
uniref:Uncharacterized protein n=1 Tax=Anguilla anguilla TaxID=7936 RepID=A0A0E9XPT6_ANGAN